MKLMQLLQESVLTIKSLTYDQLPVGRLTIPDTFDASSVIHDEDGFERWKKTFINRFGTSGSLIMDRPNHFKIVGNSTWDKYAKGGHDTLTKYYS